MWWIWLKHFLNEGEMYVCMYVRKKKEETIDVRMQIPASFDWGPFHQERAETRSGPGSDNALIHEVWYTLRRIIEFTKGWMLSILSEGLVLWRPGFAVWRRSRLSRICVSPKSKVLLLLLLLRPSDAWCWGSRVKG